MEAFLFLFLLKETKVFKVIILILALLQAGCASSQEYQHYLDTQAAIHTAKYNAEAEKYKAIAAIASSGDQTAKVAAVMALSGASSQQASFPGITAPRNGWDIARDMFSVILPPVIQGYAIHSNQKIAINQSDNNRDISISNNESMLGMAGLIQAPQANQTISGNGVIGAGSYSTPTTTTTTTTETSTTYTDSYNQTTTTNPGNTYTDSYNQSTPPVTTTP